MPTLHLLGTGAAVTDAHRTTTMLAFHDAGNTLVVDCGGDAVQRLQAAGLGLDAISALLLTHEHPDHVGGFPLFMEKIWLAGRRRALPVYGPAAALDQARRTFATFDTSRWEGLPEIQWREVALTQGAPVLADDRWTVTAAPGDHGVPVMGLRVTGREGRSVAYSCDTAPCAAIARLARRADVLVHEATGAGPNHASAEQAAEIARDADAGRLLLVHLPPGPHDEALAAARAVFPATELGEELGAYSF